jgi:hypothetical protein
VTKACPARVAAQAVLKGQLPVPSYAGSKTSAAAAATSNGSVSVPGGSLPACASTIETAVGEHHLAPPTSLHVIWLRRGTSSTGSVPPEGAEVVVRTGPADATAPIRASSGARPAGEGWKPTRRRYASAPPVGRQTSVSTSGSPTTLPRCAEARPDAQRPRQCQVPSSGACTLTSTQLPRGAATDHDATRSVRAKPGSHHGEVHVVAPSRRASRPSSGDHASYLILRGTPRR